MYQSMGKQLWLLALLTPISLDILAETVEDGRVWLTYNVEHRFNSQWKVSLQLQPYWRDEGHTYDQVTYRSGLYFQPDTHWMFGGGYAYALGHPQGNKNTHEDRLWEDAVYHFDTANFLQVSLRTRIEHRYFEKSDHRILHGLREMLKVAIPTRYPFNMVVWDECYFNLNGTSDGVHGFDQNRFFIGIASNIAPNSSLEIGYLNQFSHRSKIDTENHIVGLSLNQSF